MFFIQEDYKKILKWLLHNSVKDTEFKEALSPYQGDETVALVQNGRNVKAPLKDVLDQLLLLGVSDFMNVSAKYNSTYISLREAIRLVPFSSRKKGQVITFLNTKGNWVIYQFRGESKLQWTNESLWFNVLESIYIDAILPDEEDTTSVIEDNVARIKFSDKEFSSINSSGLGRKFIRQNKLEFNTANTRYIIQYKHNLEGKEIAIPNDSVLDFLGGEIYNGTIKFNDTLIVGTPLINTKVEGTIRNEKININNFGVFPSKTKSYSDRILELFSLNKELVFPKGKYTYLIDKPIYINTNISGDGILENISEKDCLVVKNSSFSNHIKISDITIINKELKGKEKGVHVISPYVTLSNITVKNFNIGIALSSFTLNVDNCVSNLNNKNLSIFSSDYSANDITINKGNYSSPRTNTSIIIADHEEANIRSDYLGARISLQNFSLDGGSLVINNVITTYVSNLYIENSSEIPCIILNKTGRANQLTNINIENCYIRGGSYGIKIEERSVGVDIKNNTFRYIKYVPIYFSSSGYNLNVDNNSYYNSSKCPLVHTGVPSSALHEVKGNLDSYNINGNSFLKRKFDPTTDNFYILPNQNIYSEYLKLINLSFGGVSNVKFKITGNSTNAWGEVIFKNLEDIVDLNGGMLVNINGVRGFIRKVDYSKNTIYLDGDDIPKNSEVTISSYDDYTSHVKTILFTKLYKDYDWQCPDLFYRDRGVTLFYDDNTIREIYWNGFEWVKLFGTVENLPELKNYLAGIKYLNIDTGLYLHWDGYHWRNDDDTLVSNTLIY